MPLMQSKSKKALGENIAELVRSYKNTGKIGNAKPSSVDKARKMAIAAAYSVKERAK